MVRPIEMTPGLLSNTILWKQTVLTFLDGKSRSERTPESQRVVAESITIRLLPNTLCVYALTLVQSANTQIVGKDKYRTRIARRLTGRGCNGHSSVQSYPHG
jgi:hypothetical protein